VTDPTQFNLLYVGSVNSENRSSILSFCEEVEQNHGHRILSDQLRLDLRDASATEPPVVAVAGVGDDIVATSLATRSNEGWTLEVVSQHDHAFPPSREVINTVVRGILSELSHLPLRRLTWWARAHDPWVEHVASGLGFSEYRRLHQMRIALTSEVADRFRGSAAETRAFRLNADEQAWLAVNNSAFATHEEQGGWSLEQLTRRLDAPWFDAEDVRLHPVIGDLDAFCWTKRHEADLHEPMLGEIYAIAVNPSEVGQGLGKQMVMAGFSHLADTGISIGMLYVDANNEAAMSLYESIGMEVHHTDRAYLWAGS
jgi:mycothiol synthase